MDSRATPYLRALWIGTILFVAGIARDLQWHATHDEFEGTSQQFAAHWLLWIGFLVVLVAVVLAFIRLTSDERHPGFTVALAAAAVYLPRHRLALHRPRQWLRSLDRTRRAGDRRCDDRRGDDLDAGPSPDGTLAARGRRVAVFRISKAAR